MGHSERYKRGLEELKMIDGEAGEKLLESLKDISPDLGRFIIEYAFGDVYANNTLAPNLQEVAVVAALSAIGAVEPQLKIHINAALNVGCTINELKELFLQIALAAGFPKSINAMLALKEVLEERKEKGVKDVIDSSLPDEGEPSLRYERGRDRMDIMDPSQFELLNNAYSELAPELLQYILEFGYGDVISRTNFDPLKRQIAIISALTALGNVGPQLRVHINIGLNLGLSTQEIKEIMLLISVYAGFPSCTNGINMLKKVLENRNGK